MRLNHLIFSLALLLLVSCGGGGSPSTTAPLGSPEILHVITFKHAGVNYASIEWTPVPGAVSYNVYIGTTVLVFDNVTVTYGYITPRRVIGFQDGVRYEIYLTAVNEAEESPPSNTVWFIF